jgi:hypothetical protein
VLKFLCDLRALRFSDVLKLYHFCREGRICVSIQAWSPAARPPVELSYQHGSLLRPGNPRTRSCDIGREDLAPNEFFELTQMLGVAGAKWVTASSRVCVISGGLRFFSLL